MAITKLEGVTRDGRQAYVVRWDWYDEHGVRRQRERRLYGKSEAIAYERERLGEVAQQRPRDVANRTVTVLEAAEQWLTDYANRPRPRAVDGRVQRSSWDEAARAVEHLVELVGGDRQFASLTTEDLFKAVDSRTNMRTGEPVADGTKERMVGVLKALCSDARRRGWHPENIATDLPSSFGRYSQRAYVPRLRVLQDVAGELDRRTIHVNNRWGDRSERLTWSNAGEAPDTWVPSDRLWLLAYTGLDFGEARGLRPEDDHGRYIRLTETWPKSADAPRGHGKASSRVPRDVPVPEVLRPPLDRLKAHTRCGRLMTDPVGQILSYETWRNQFANATSRAGVELTSKMLRHFAASLWIRAGASPLLVQRAGGWSSLAMVGQVYGHLFPSDVAQLSAHMDALDTEILD